MTLTIGENGLDTDKWMEVFKSHFPTPPDGEYEVSFVYEDEEYPLGVYDFHGEVRITSSCDEEEDGGQDVPDDVMEGVMEDVANLGITILGINIFSDLLKALATLLLCQTGEFIGELVIGDNV
jgi:hypothetical protein